jgi:spermidine/putrescine transport system ATP-binding protein
MLAPRGASDPAPLPARRPSHPRPPRYRAARTLPDSTPAIELLNATKQYGEVTALDHVSMIIEPGEFFCLLGPSGCGKTTTLNLIGGFIPVTSGELRIEGRKVNDLPPHKRNVNTVFQNYALFPHMTVAQNVAFGLRMEKLSTDEVTRRTGEYLELVGLSGLSGRLPSEMSGGQQQRVALARALAKRPAVLLLDEPLGALDLKLRKNMQAELSRIHRQVGTTFVFVTHDQDEALSMATRIAIMSGGQVAQTGSPREVYDHPVNRFVADFVGETNFLTGTIETDGSRPMFVIPGGERVLAPGGSADGPATLMLRPESVAIRAVGVAAAEPGVTGRVTNVAFLGNHTRITVTTAAGEIFAVRPHGTSGRTTGPLEEVGKEVCVWWAADDAALIGD